MNKLIGYEQAFASAAIGTNVVAVIPGSDLAHEYVMLGAHYDHLGTGAGGVFNGATDNAAGVAAVVAVGRAIAALPAPPRRSIILALWDAEEDGLVGSRAFAASPLVPLASIVAYVNLDILGANLLPALRDTSFAVGAESGGATLRAMVQSALTAEGTLDVKPFSRVFGQERSDHASFIGAIPSVFFSDSTGGCYHTAQDDIDVVDLGKLRSQARIVLRLVIELAETSTPPALVPTTITGNTFEDAVGVAAVIDGAVADLALFAPAQQSTLLAGQATVQAIVADGPAAFDPNSDGFAVLAAAVQSLGTLATLPCDGYLAPEPVPIGPARPGVWLPLVLGLALLWARARSCRRQSKPALPGIQ